MLQIQKAFESTNQPAVRYRSLAVGRRHRSLLLLLRLLLLVVIILVFILVIPGPLLAPGHLDQCLSALLGHDVGLERDHLGQELSVLIFLLLVGIVVLGLLTPGREVERARVRVLGHAGQGTRVLVLDALGDLKKRELEKRFISV